MNSTILLLIILLLINLVQFATIQIFSELYNKNIELTEKLTDIVMNKTKKEEQNNEKNMEQPKTEEEKPGLVYPENERRVY